MEELLAGIEDDERAIRALRRGEVVEGTVASVSGDAALVDLGGRSAGVFPFPTRAEKERMSRSATEEWPRSSNPKRAASRTLFATTSASGFR